MSLTSWTYFMGSSTTHEILLRTAMRSFCEYSSAWVHAVSTVRSVMNASRATATPSTVSPVRTLLRSTLRAASSGKFT